jgi:uncharacterized membrane protein YhdT
VVNTALGESDFYKVKDSHAYGKHSAAIVAFSFLSFLFWIFTTFYYFGNDIDKFEDSYFLLWFGSGCFALIQLFIAIPLIFIKHVEYRFQKFQGLP